MNENLKNYKADPDPEVWEGIEKTMRRRTLRRYGWTAAVGAVVVAAAIVGVVHTSPRAAQGEGYELRAANNESKVIAALAPDNSHDMAPLAGQPQSGSKPAEVIQAIAVAPAVSQHTPAQPTAPAAAAPVQQEASAKSQISNIAAQVAEPAPAQPAAPAADNLVQQETRDNGQAAAPKSSASEPAPAKAEPKSSFNTNIEDTIVWLPNIFAPGSGDEAISVFRARLNKPGESISNFKMMIFNRAGHQVFVSHDINYGWDGTYKGRELPQATYVYVLYYTDSDRFQHQRKGTITLVR